MHLKLRSEKNVIIPTGDRKMENCRVHVSSISAWVRVGRWRRRRVCDEGGGEEKKKEKRKKERKKARDGKTDKEEPMDGDRARKRERKNGKREREVDREGGGTTTNGRRRGREFTRRGDAAQVLSGTKKWLFLLECARCTCTFSRRTDGPRVVA